MRKSRFTEVQIIGMIKEQEVGMPSAWPQPGDVLQIQGQVRRDERVRRQKAAGA